MKKNQPTLRWAIGEWLQEKGVWPGEAQRPPDAVQVNKGHGRLERRELWIEAVGTLGEYLRKELDWPGAQWCGRIRRYRRELRSGKVSQQDELWIAGAAFELPGDGKRALAWLRGHWGIENKVFYVRDVTYDEDRWHGRTIGLPLSSVRNVALNVIRKTGFRWIPDGHRTISARSDLGLFLLLAPYFPP